jgi:F-type H+-transporting ATPase subunit c
MLEMLLLPMLAQAEALISGRGLIAIGIGLGFGLTILGAGKGIGNIGGHAVESIARQPEAGGPIGTNMIIAAALVEGLAIISMILLFVVTFVV